MDLQSIPYFIRVALLFAWTLNGPSVLLMQDCMGVRNYSRTSPTVSQFSWNIRGDGSDTLFETICPWDLAHNHIYVMLYNEGEV
jgi:hypothetical protein